MHFLNLAYIGFILDEFIYIHPAPSEAHGLLSNIKHFRALKSFYYAVNITKWCLLSCHDKIERMFYSVIFLDRQ